MTTEIAGLLKEWGVTIGLLAVAATALLTLLVLSLREFAFWFFRLNQILANQKEVLARLESLEKTVKDDAALLSALTTAEVEPAKSNEAKFPISKDIPEKNYPLSN